MDPTDVPHCEIAPKVPSRPPKPLVLPRRHVIREKRAREEVASLQNQLRGADDEIRKLKDDLKEARESAKSHPDDAVSRLQAHLTCGICTKPLWDPFVLECGHIFCHNCLRQWFSTALSAHVANHPGYDPRSCVPAELFAWIRERRLGKFAHCYVLSVIDQLIASTNHPAYTCPCCRAAVKNAPIAVFPLKALVHDLMGESDRGPGEGSQLPQWEDFLPFNARDLVATQ